MRNWWTSIRSPYAAVLIVGAFAAWVAVPQIPDDNPPAATTAAVTDSRRLNSPDPRPATDLIVEMTNELREHQGLEHVKVNTPLSRAARYFANYMAGMDKYSHTADGKTPSQRAEENGYDFCLVSENIAYVYSSTGYSTQELADDMVEGWQESPEHRKNMLDSAVTEIGVAVAHSSKSGNYYGVQMFGRPQALSFRFTIENQSEIPLEYTVGERAYELPPKYRQTQEECLPAALTFHLPGESEPARHTYRPQNGDVFIIVGQGGRLKIEKTTPSGKKSQ